MKIIICVALMLSGLTARADIIADGSIGLTGDIRNVQDCYSIGFSYPEDQDFFKQFCLGAVISARIIQTINGTTISPEALQKWLQENDLATWAAKNLAGLAPGDLNIATSRAEKILSVIRGKSPNQGGGEQNSAWIYYIPYPSLREKCLGEGNTRFHGALLIDFSWSTEDGTWIIPEIRNAVNCRKT